MLLKLRGKIEFSPKDMTNKQKSQSGWKRVAIIKTDCDLDRYYAWFLEKRFNLKLNRNIRGSHITFISDVLDKNIFNEGYSFFNGKEIDFYLELEPRSSGEHWWLRVFSPDAESIREALGLTREPYFSFHFTIGSANEKNIAHSEYILEQCKRFKIMSDEKSKLDDYEIRDFTKSLNSK